MNQSYIVYRFGLTRRRVVPSLTLPIGQRRYLFTDLFEWKIKVWNRKRASIIVLPIGCSSYEPHRWFHEGWPDVQYISRNDSYLTYIDGTLKNDTSYYLGDLWSLIDKRCVFSSGTRCDWTTSLRPPLIHCFSRFYKCKPAYPSGHEDTRLINTCHYRVVILQKIYSFFKKKNMYTYLHLKAVLPTVNSWVWVVFICITSYDNIYWSM